jgi:hypothetical protein
MTQNLQYRAPKGLLKVARQFSVSFETRSQARAVDKIMLEPRCGAISPECKRLFENSEMCAISGTCFERFRHVAVRYSSRGGDMRKPGTVVPGERK